jgi:hypothetical protein
MQISIPSELFMRFSHIALDTDVELYRSLYVESIGGNTFYIATNVKIAVLQYVKTGAADGKFNLAYSPELLEQVKKELPYNGNIDVVYIDALKHATAKTTFGYVHPKNAAVFANTNNDFLKWREWFPSLATETNGGICFSAEMIQKIIQASPSGVIAMQKFIDITKPVLCKDAFDSGFLGSFIGMCVSDTGKIIADDFKALPEWLK